MKVSDKEKQKIQEIYSGYRKKGFPKELSYRLTAGETGRGRTTVLDNVAELEYPIVETKQPELNYKGQSGTYIITGWEVRVGIDEKFVETLKLMAEFYNAELLLVPCQASDAAYLPDKLKEVFTIVTNDIKFNDNLTLRYVETSALVQSPIGGHIGAYDHSTIIPGLIKEMRLQPSQNYVHQLTSTGSVGYLDTSFQKYESVGDDKDFVRRMRSILARRNSKSTAVADNYVVPSALIVDVLDKKTFLSRFVTSFKNGVVYDLGYKFTPENVEPSQPLALNVGDTHAYFVDRSAWNATKEMVAMLNPKEVILNDFWDGCSVNHHEIGDPIRFANVPSIREEADVTIELLKEICDISNKVIYLNSNHENFLIKYLNMGDRIWRYHRNYEIACGLQFYRAQTGKHPIFKLLELNKFDNLKYVTEHDSHYAGKVLIRHGHEGLSGRPATFQSLARLYNFYSQGHSHSMAVFRNAAMAGCTARLDMDYAMGANSWIHGNIIIQPDSSQQAIPIIYGRWINAG